MQLSAFFLAIYSKNDAENCIEIDQQNGDVMTFIFGQPDASDGKKDDSRVW